jgi:hypothetical protein
MGSDKNKVTPTRSEGMSEYKILKVDTTNMEFKKKSEQVWIPIIVGIKEDIVDRFVFLTYRGANKSFSIQSRNQYSDLQTREIINAFQTEPEIEHERKLVNDFIEKWSVEKPLPEIEISELKLDSTGNVVVKLEGKGLGIGADTPFIIFLKPKNSGNRKYIRDFNSTYLGFSTKVYEIIKKKVRLYLIMAHGE